MDREQQLHNCIVVGCCCTTALVSTAPPSSWVTFGAALARSRTSCLQTFAGTFTSAVTQQWSLVTGHRCDGVTPARVTSTSRLRQTFSKLELFSSFKMRTTKLTFRGIAIKPFSICSSYAGHFMIYVEHLHLHHTLYCNFLELQIICYVNQFLRDNFLCTSVTKCGLSQHNVFNVSQCIMSHGSYPSHLT